MMTTRTARLLLLLLIPLLVMATPLGDLDDIATAIRQGNAKGLSAHFDSMVELKWTRRKAPTQSTGRADRQDFSVSTPDLL